MAPIPAEFGGLKVEPLEELPEAGADLSERFVEHQLLAEVILALQLQVFQRILLRGVGRQRDCTRRRRRR